MQSDLLNLKNDTAESQKQTGKNQSISHPKGRFSLFFDLSQCFPFFCHEGKAFSENQRHHSMQQTRLYQGTRENKESQDLLDVRISSTLQSTIL
jgi:hypothetical protein